MKDRPPPVTRSLEELRAEGSRLRRGCTAATTRYSYASDWGLFLDWCVPMKQLPLPCSPETLALYATDLLSRGHKVTTVERRCYGAAYVHKKRGLPSPFTPEVRSIIIGAQRLTGEQPRQMRPLTVAQLSEICGQLGKERTTIAIRDRAIMLLGFASALRRSNIAALLVSDIKFGAEGMTIQVRREKQDQTGRGRLIGLPRGKHVATDPCRAMEAWLALRGGGPGPLFVRLDTARPRGRSALTPVAIWLIVKRCVRKIGLDPLLYGAHSLRAGLVTEAVERGVNELVIAAQTGHRSLACLRRYFRPQDVFRANACNSLGL